MSSTRESPRAEVLFPADLPQRKSRSRPPAPPPTPGSSRRPLVAALAIALGLGAIGLALVMRDSGSDRNPLVTPTEFRLAADLGCFDDDECLGALAPVYGFDLTGRLAVLPDGESVVDAAKSREVDVVVLKSVAEAEAAGLTVLTEDQGLFSGDATVAVGFRPGLEDGGSLLQDATETVLTALSDAELRGLVAQVEAGARPVEVATAWVATESFPDLSKQIKAAALAIAEERSSRSGGSDDEAAPAPTKLPLVRVGGAVTDRGQVLSAATVLALREQGFSAKTAKVSADPAAMMQAAQDGTVSLVVEHLNPLLLAVTDSRNTAFGDPQVSANMLRDRLSRRDLAVFGPGAALGGPVLAVTEEASQRLNLRTWSDLAKFGDSANKSIPAELPVPIKATDVDLGVGDTGPAVKALQARLVQVGHSPGRTDGYFDERTRRAVVAFQQSQILPMTGNVGPLTRRRLDVPYGPEGEKAAAAEAAVAEADATTAEAQ